MQNTLTEKKGITKSALQIIAVIAMLIGHVWLIDKMWYVSNPWVYAVMEFVGTLTIVIMTYFVAEGYHKTKDLSKYIWRLGLFAVISQLPYYFACNGFSSSLNMKGLIVSIFYDRNVIFTLFVGLCLLAVVKSTYNLLIKLVAIFAALWLAKYSDWSYYAILWIIGFGLFYGDKRKQMLWLVAVVLVRLMFMAVEPVMGIIQFRTLKVIDLCNWIANFGCLMAIPLLTAYKGERGNMPKWTFYVIYPLQFIVLIILNMVL